MQCQFLVFGLSTLEYNETYKVAPFSGLSLNLRAQLVSSPFWNMIIVQRQACSSKWFTSKMTKYIFCTLWPVISETVIMCHSQKKTYEHYYWFILKISQRSHRILLRFTKIKIRKNSDGFLQAAILYQKLCFALGRLIITFYIRLWFEFNLGPHCSSTLFPLLMC